MHRNVSVTTSMAVTKLKCDGDDIQTAMNTTSVVALKVSVCVCIITGLCCVPSPVCYSSLKLASVAYKLLTITTDRPAYLHMLQHYYTISCTVLYD